MTALRGDKSALIEVLATWKKMHWRIQVSRVAPDGRVLNDEDRASSCERPLTTARSWSYNYCWSVGPPAFFLSSISNLAREFRLRRFFSAVFVGGARDAARPADRLPEPQSRPDQPLLVLGER